VRDWKAKRYWLVGASEGLGLALARLISGAGAEVILSGRDPARLAAAVAQMPGKARAVPCDVASRESVEAAAAEAGEIDGVVFLAGVYWPMPAQDWNAAHAEAMADINFTGCVRVIGAALPPMVRRDRGHVVITGSLSGYRGLPGAIGYSAAKAGTMVLAECLYADLRDTGVTVQIANPGFIRTRLTDKNDFKMPFLMEPEAAAQEMFELMNSDNFKKSFPALFALFFRIGNFLPDWLYYRVFSKKG
jgi:NAD(P)-dependent dehydrogenase (short-subunit alcohol dehydrogenase family)